MNSEKKQNRNAKGYVKFIAFLLGVIVVLVYIGITQGIKMPISSRDFIPSIEGVTNVTVENRITSDKKYAWVVVEAKWKITNVQKLRVSEDETRLANYVNTVLGSQIKMATAKAMLLQSSEDIKNKRKNIAEKIYPEIADTANTIFKDNKSLIIVWVEVKEVRIFDAPYEGQELPKK